MVPVNFLLDSLGIDGLKVLLESIHTCHGTTPQHVRTWYQFFTAHAASFGYYIHPYYCFRKGISLPNGFTCWFDTPSTQFDLPGNFLTSIINWISALYNAISTSHVFKSNTCQNLIVDQYYGNGHETFYHLIAPDHPINSF